MNKIENKNDGVSTIYQGADGQEHIRDIVTEGPTLGASYLWMKSLGRVRMYQGSYWWEASRVGGRWEAWMDSAGRSYGVAAGRTPGRAFRAWRRRWALAAATGGAR